MLRIRSLAIVLIAALLVSLSLPYGMGGATTALASGTNGPSLNQQVPQLGDTEVPSGSDLKLTFDEYIIRGAGSITITKDGNPFDSLDVQNDLGNVLLEQPTKVVTIVPKRTLTPGNYSVTIPEGVFASQSTGKVFGAITSWSFTVANIATTYDPYYTNDVSADAAITISATYSTSKTMKKGTGNIYVKRASDNATVQTISASGSSVTVSGQKVSIKLSKLDYSTSYYILMDMGAILDSKNSEYGIADSTTWNFTTKAQIDKTAPTVVAFKPTNGGTMGGLRGTLSVEFSEPVYAGSGTITLKKGSTTICTIAADSGAVSGYGNSDSTITINPTNGYCPDFVDNTTYSVTISNLAFHDAAGNNYAGTSNWSFKVVDDVEAPEIVSLTPAAGATNVKVNVGTLSMKFNKPVNVLGNARIKTVSGPSAGYFISDIPLSVSSSDPTVVNIKLPTGTTLSRSTKYAVYIEPGVIWDTTNNNNVFPGILNDYRWSFQTVGSDTTAPSFVSAAMDGMSVVLTYNEELDKDSVPSPANYYVTVNDVAVQVSSVEVAGKQVWVKLQKSVAVGQKVMIAYTVFSNPLMDLSGNRAASLGSTTVSNTSSTTVPKPSSGSIAGNVLTLTFNKTLNDLPSNAASQFSVKYDGSSVGIRSVSLNGTVITFVLNGSPSTSQSVSVSYSPNSTTPIRDKSGNAMTAFSDFYVTNGIDTTAPTLSSGTASGNQVTLNFNEGLNPNSVPPKSSFSVLSNGTASAISSVAINNNSVVLTLSYSITSGTVLVTYIPGTTPLEDLAGNEAALISSYAITVGSGNAAKYSSGSINGSTITLNFSSSLNSGYVPNGTQFQVTVGGNYAMVSTVQVSGAAVTLNLTSQAIAGQAVTVSYYSTGNSLKDNLGLTVASFGPVTLTNSSGAGSLNSYLEYNSEGGLTFNKTGATTSTSTLSSGAVANLYTLNAEYLTNALALLQKGTNISKLQVNFVVPTTESGALVALPLQALITGASINPQAVIRVDYGDYQFEYPLLALSSSSLNQKFYQDGSAYLLLQIEKSSNSSLVSKITSQGGTILTSLVDFSAYTVVNGTRTEVTAYDNYVTRSITVGNASNLKNSQLSVVRYDPDANDISYVPTTITRNGTTTKLSFERKGNSVYAAVYYAKSYSDVTAAWAKESVNGLSSKFIVEGKSLNTFQPDQNVTRADFAKWIAKGLGLSSQKSAAARFSDVGVNGANAGYIGAASAAGIVQGGSDGLFRPNAYITREEMATMMQRAITYVGLSVNATGSELNGFTDKAKISSYAKNAALQSVAAGIMNGVSSNQFKPQDNASRAQAAVMIDRLLKYIGFMQV
ncbi:SwmB domain-containing protein [Cohnella sp. AR92]|uniref:Ig-like domain-containing protein n=1 Tax=Cohnella sp. AR92 TaxID=648716 RepID=UPI000F8E11C3|nr:SwmB domain-containing protein [Cohnella sp. AR92]RUS42621.1 hypothetical protein ELR57_26605 [Cohnella sp. AR92]